MYICIYKHAHTHVYTLTHTHTHTCPYVYIYIYINTHTHTYIRRHTHTHAHRQTVHKAKTQPLCVSLEFAGQNMRAGQHTFTPDLLFLGLSSRVALDSDVGTDCPADFLVFDWQTTIIARVTECCTGLILRERAGMHSGQQVCMVAQCDCFGHYHLPCHHSALSPSPKP